MPLMVPFKRFAALTLLLLAAVPLAAFGSSVQVTRQIIKTYPFSDPDPVPILARKGFDKGDSPIYPYCAFDGFSKEAVDREWTVVKLENPWLEVYILPEVAGKVWGAREKTTGREFIYTNHVLKFRQVALRGPWTSGGLEFNFGVVGHTPTCATPVDYLTRQEPDGGASCVVGALDLPSRTRWSVTITLPPDKAYFETKAFWDNPTPLHQSYYNWMNAAVRVGDDLQYSYPGDRSIGHNYRESPRPWPFDNGRDLTWYKNHNFGSYQSYFTFGEFKDFFGTYWHNLGLGFGHWAHYDDAPGRKLWIWGLSREGMIWEDLLTDKDGQYSEPQSGRYLDQSDTAFFQPGATDRWREIWFPYKETGPIMAASPLGVLNVTTGTQGITVSLCALQEFNETLFVGFSSSSHGSEWLLSQQLHLQPMQVFQKTIPVKEWRQDIWVSVGNHMTDKLLWESNHNHSTLNRPLKFHEYDTATAEGLYLQAERLEKGRKFKAALALYQQCLAKEPQHVRALCRIAELHLRRVENREAEAAVRKALEIDMYDPQANFIYSQLCSDRSSDQYEALGWAARSMEYRSAAYERMAELKIADRRPEEAIEYARRAVEANANNVTARLTIAVADRILGRTEEAKAELARILEIDPLNPGARFEGWLLDETPEKLKAFQAPVTGESPQETYLELAIFYDRIMQREEAGKLLALSPQTPEILYWRATLTNEIAEKEKLLAQADAMSPRLVFPFRPESIRAIYGSNWKQKYYLGLIYWGLGQTDRARYYLEECQKESDFAPLFIDLGLMTKKQNPARALDYFKTALAKDRKEWRAWHYLASAQLETGKTSDSLALAREAAAAFPDQDAVRLDLVKALRAAGHDEEALVILERSTFLPFEGASEVHKIFVDCQLTLAAAKIKSGQYEQALKYIEGARRFPENLGSGQPYTPDFRRQDTLKAQCLEKMGRTAEAEQVRKEMRKNRNREE